MRHAASARTDAALTPPQPLLACFARFSISLCYYIYYVANVAWVASTESRCKTRWQFIIHYVYYIYYAECRHFALLGDDSSDDDLLFILFTIFIIANA